MATRLAGKGRRAGALPRPRGRLAPLHVVVSLVRWQPGGMSTNSPDAGPARLRDAAWQALRLGEPTQKIALLGLLDATTAVVDTQRALPPIDEPGRPPRPELVHPARVPRRSTGSDQGRAALLHAIAHIEFNAINLALDAVARFAGLPEAYYRDWWRVACEEAHHFSLLAAHLVLCGRGQTGCRKGRK